MSGAALPDDVRELLAAVYEALAIPFPATVGDKEAYTRVLAERAGHVRVALDGVLAGKVSLGIAWEVDYLRERLAEHPPAYRAWDVPEGGG